ncbi:MAG: VIT family protein [Deltaproteobacteria bacterium]|nr:VIT family protein [Deltaproteobacteria bacterium]
MRKHVERHYAERIGWLRAAVLGANDGLVSTASLLLGVVAAKASATDILLTGTAGLFAGSMSMAAGEFVSVSSQRDTEKADIDRERRELAENVAHERNELAGIYVARGLDPDLAERVADQLMRHDALGAHMRDELGLIETHAARPVQAAAVSAATFAAGALWPLMIAVLSPATHRFTSIAAGSLLCLVILGVLGARAGGAGLLRGAARVALWGSLAMGVTALAGKAFSAFSSTSIAFARW